MKPTAGETTTPKTIGASTPGVPVEGGLDRRPSTPQDPPDRDPERSGDPGREHLRVVDSAMPASPSAGRDRNDDRRPATRPIERIGVERGDDLHAEPPTEHLQRRRPRFVLRRRDEFTQPAPVRTERHDRIDSAGDRGPTMAIAIRWRPARFRIGVGIRPGIDPREMTGIEQSIERGLQPTTVRTRGTDEHFDHRACAIDRQVPLAPREDPIRLHSTRIAGPAIRAA